MDKRRWGNIIFAVGLAICMSLSLFIAKSSEAKDASTESAKAVVFFEKDGVIAIEAETFTSQKLPTGYPADAAQWEVSNKLTGFGGTGYATSDKAKRKGVLDAGKGPCAIYDITVKEAGKYYAAVRGNGDGAGADSLYIGINGQKSDRIGWDGETYFNMWYWCFSNDYASKAETIDVPAGKVSVELCIREAGTSIDQILLLKGKEKMPTKQEPLKIAQ
jgi:hypothetical protein